MVVHPANIQDRDGAKLLFEKVKGNYPRLSLVWADGGYAGQLIGWLAHFCQWTLEIVKRNELPGFHILPRRWVVERTFGWIGRYRRMRCVDRKTCVVSNSSHVNCVGHIGQMHLANCARSNRPGVTSGQISMLLRSHRPKSVAN